MWFREKNIKTTMLFKVFAELFNQKPTMFINIKYYRGRIHLFLESILKKILIKFLLSLQTPMYFRDNLCD